VSTQQRRARHGFPHEPRPADDPVRYTDVGPGTPRVDVESTALHEAGHAVIALAYGSEVDEVTIVPDPHSRTYGFTSYMDTYHPRSLPAEITEREWPEIGKGIVHILAGPVVTARVTLLSVPEQFGYAGDYAQAQRTAVERGIPITRVDEFLAWLSERAEREVTRRWDSIVRVALALLARRTLTGEEVHAIVRG